MQLYQMTGYFQLLTLCCCSAVASGAEVSSCTVPNSKQVNACLDSTIEDMKADESGSIDDVSMMQTILSTAGLSSQEHLSLKPPKFSHLDVEYLNVSHDEPTLLSGNTSGMEATHTNTLEVTKHQMANEAAQKLQRIPDSTLPLNTTDPTKPHSTSMFSFWDFDYKMTLGELCFCFLCIVIREIGLSRNWFGKQEFNAKHRWYMKMTEVIRLLVAAADYSFMIPMALTVARALGGDVVISGFLISTYALGVGIGTLFSMRWLTALSHESRRRALVLILTFTSMCEGLLSVLMTVPALQHAGFLTVLTLFVRVIAGFASGWGSSHLLIVGTVCTPQEMNNFEQWAPIADFAGLMCGVGFVALALAMNQAVTPTDYFAACSGPMLTIGCLQMILAAEFSFMIPLDLEQVSHHNDDEREAMDIVDYAPDILGAEAVDVISSKNREDIAVSGFVTVGLVALSSIGIESGTSYMMEHLYKWSPDSIAIALTVMLAAVCVNVALFSVCRVHWGTSIDRRLAIPILLLSMGATVLYFPHSFGWEGKYHLFVGDGIIFPTVTLLGGVVMGYAVWASNPEKWNYRLNVVSTAQVIDSSMKFLGAPAIRVLIELVGRETYAIMQVIMITFLLMIFIWVRNVDMYVDKATLDECVPSGKGFFQEMKNKRERFMKNFRSES